jgi:hypothetical protein
MLVSSQLGPASRSRGTYARLGFNISPGRWHIIDLIACKRKDAPGIYMDFCGPPTDPRIINDEPGTAWAIAVFDSLRRAGFDSFVSSLMQPSTPGAVATGYIPAQPP